jgi:hypothetical protein
MQAPETDLSSIVAEESRDVPDWSTHETSTVAMMAILGSALIALILSLPIGKNLEQSSAQSKP